MREFICRWFFHGHRWDEFATFKRRCVRCNVEEWIFTKTYPSIGEPKSDWSDMTIRSFSFRWRLHAWLAGLNG